MTVPRVVLLPSVRAVAVIEGLCSSVGVAAPRNPEVLDWGLSIPAATDARLRRD